MKGIISKEEQFQKIIDIIESAKKQAYRKANEAIS